MGGFKKNLKLALWGYDTIGFAMFSFLGTSTINLDYFFVSLCLFYLGKLKANFAVLSDGKVNKLQTINYPHLASLVFLFPHILQKNIVEND